MRTYFIMIALGGIALIASACNSSSFLVYKDGHGYFLGSNSNAKYDLLCDSGDLEKVLASSHLSKDMKDALYKYNCSAERSSEKIKQLYVSMTPDQRKDIKRAFRSNGYEINYMAC